MSFFIRCLVLRLPTGYSDRSSFSYGSGTAIVDEEEVPGSFFEDVGGEPNGSPLGDVDVLPLGLHDGKWGACGLD